MHDRELSTSVVLGARGVQDDLQSPRQNFKVSRHLHLRWTPVPVACRSLSRGLFFPLFTLLLELRRKEGKGPGQALVSPPQALVLPTHCRCLSSRLVCIRTAPHRASIPIWLHLHALALARICTRTGAGTGHSYSRCASSSRRALLPSYSSQLTWPALSLPYLSRPRPRLDLDLPAWLCFASNGSPRCAFLALTVWNPETSLPIPSVHPPSHSIPIPDPISPSPALSCRNSILSLTFVVPYCRTSPISTSTSTSTLSSTSTSTIDSDSGLDL